MFHISFRLLILVTGFVMLTGPMAAQSAKSAGAKSKSPALLTFSQGVTVTRSEFERVYAKNNGGTETASTHTPEQYREYLNLYINFKRKVFEAEALGLDTTRAFRQEFTTYRKQLAQPYLSARETEERLLQEAYDRGGYLVNADHILVSVAEDALPEDTLRAYNLIRAYRDSVVTGGRAFGDMAAKYSSDPSAKTNKGNLGYFTAFDMVYPFENAAFTTAPGSISQPVRTRFGYHIVKVNEKIVTEGKKQAAHIIVRVGDRFSAKDDAQAQKKIQEIYQMLKQGQDFATLASQFSDDPSSAPRGGDLGTTRLLPEMEAIKLRLTEGEYSEPFMTQFGWHILKVTAIERRQAFDQVKPELKQKIARDTRSQLSRTALIQKIKTENKFTLNEAAFTAFKASLDPNFLQQAWAPDPSRPELYTPTLFSLNGKPEASIQDFVTYYKTLRQRNTRLTPAQAADQYVNSYIEQRLLQYEEDHLADKNEDFRYLVQEYHDGILLFTLMEQRVWKKAVEDTTGLKNYYETHQAEFQAGEMADVREYRASDRQALQLVADMLARGESDQTIDSLANRESSLKLRISQQTYERAEMKTGMEIFDQPVGYRSAILEEDGMYKILITEKKYPAGIKPFDKARSECITRYQDYLEKQWLAELATKYPVTVHEKVFKKLFK
ncbi:MAG: peptidylprolyl isomerase [Bacteroidia bacterium]|nr:peptidylprolyl isomerase [Bacteroidia bacterium]